MPHFSVLLSMDDRTKAAFESIRDSTKQMITLATGVLALTVTFAKDFIGGGAQGRWLVHAAWYAFFLSAAAGVWVLLAVSGSLGNGPDSITHKDAYGLNIRLPALVQVLSFATGLALAVVFGTRN